MFTEESALDKTRQRVDALTSAAERGGKSANSKFVELSQSEYIEHIHQIHENMKSYWENGRKVDALKSAVQCSKLLCHPRAPGFYPSIFVLVTSALDTFGQLVFKRIRKSAEEQYRKMSNGAKLPEDFSPNDIGSAAREVCKNWMFKTACIRELLPRLYIEMALLPCYRFLSDADYALITLRLTQSCRGLGDPLVAIFARWYLARNVYKLVHHQPSRERFCIFTALNDYLVSSYLCVAQERTEDLESKGVNMQKYLWLQRPALKWLFHQLARTKCEQGKFDEILSLYQQHVCPAFHKYYLSSRIQGSKESKKSGGALVILDCLFDAFPGDVYSNNISKLVSLVESAADMVCPEGKPTSGSDKYERLVELVHPAHVYRSITKGLISSPPPKEKMTKYLNKSWKVISNLGSGLSSLKLFASCAEIYTAFVLRWMDTASGTVLLKEIARHVARAQHESHDDSLPDSVLDSLQNILTQHLYHTSQALEKGVDEDERRGLIDNLTSEHFVFLLDSFPPRRKQVVSENLLTAFVSSSAKISDNVLLQNMLDVARNVAKGMDSMAGNDAKRRVDTILSSFIRKPYFSRDLERHLSLLVDARGAFSYANSDVVNCNLIYEALKLCIQALNFVKFRHKDETRSFVKTVLAYCHVTIPSLADPLKRIMFFSHSGEIALANNCVGQADGLFRAAVQEIPIVASALDGEPVNSAKSLLDLYDKKTLEPEFLRSIDFMCSRLLTMPGHPQHGPIYLLRSVLNASRRVPWKPERGGLCHVLLNLLNLVFCFCQNRIPPSHRPRIADFEWNSELFANDPMHSQELVDMMQAIINNFISDSDTLLEHGKSNDAQALDAHACNLFRFMQLIVGHVLADTSSDDSNPLVATLIVLDTSKHAKKSMSAKSVADWLSEQINASHVQNHAVFRRIQEWKTAVGTDKETRAKATPGPMDAQATKLFKASERQWFKWIFGSH